MAPFSCGVPCRWAPDLQVLGKLIHWIFQQIRFPPRPSPSYRFYGDDLNTGSRHWGSGSGVQFTKVNNLPTFALKHPCSFAGI